ncbi:hypothetical protein ACA910_021125 [Epithemia clementina (nom. ined.)]
MNSFSEISSSSPMSHEYPSDPMELSLPALLISNNVAGGGLAQVPVDVLQQYVEPILDGLQRIDAESLLELDRTNEGAVLYKGVTIRPIHNQISPPCSADKVRYIHLAELTGQYSMGIFIFPPHARIPLHDHPGMCVLSRVLYGSLERVSLDLAREDQEEEEDDDDDDDSTMIDINNNNHHHRGTRSVGDCSKNNNNTMDKAKANTTRRAYRKRVDYLEAPDCVVLYPFEGNLHEFRAGPHGAAVLDVLLPPYQDHDRDCTFYDIIGQSSGIVLNRHHQQHHQQQQPQSSKSYDHESQPCWWLVPTGQPEDFHCVSGRYRTLGASDLE